jgi:fused signal recognition particle receptor
MGMIRKTLSIGTLGLVSWRSKAEKLEIAEYVLAQAEARTEAEHAARLGAEARADRATAELVRSAKQSRRQRRREETKTLLAKSSEAVEEIGHAVAHSAKAAEPKVRRARRHARRSAKQARRTATTRAQDLAGTVKEQAETAKEIVLDQAEVVRSKAASLTD